MDILTGLLNFIPHVIILIAVILYLKKYSAPEGVMMLIGAVTGALISLYYSMALPYLAREAGGYDSVQQYFTIIRTIGTFGAFSFAIGLLLAFQKLTAAPKKV